MKITFNEIKFRNFLSYGNKVTTLNLNHQGLIQISGKNGCGKSTMFDALSFCLFGRPFRKVKKGELVNRENGKDLWTQVTFHKNTIKYRITRTIAPNSI
jgi:DNA repair exonuclease SbcCD ATPase subunit